MIGNPGEWGSTVTGVTLNDKLYTVEESGVLYETNLSTSSFRALGDDYQGTTGILAGGKTLWVFSEDGSLYNVLPTDGSWTLIGRAWPETIAGTNYGDTLYTVESSGVLYKTYGPTGDWMPLGESDFADTVWMGYSQGYLYTIESDGSLYRINLE